MSSVLVINAAGRETRVALVEGGHIAEFYLERKKDKGVVGNIYKGRVVRVLPGMQAAFVDIGLEKAAFLYVSDVVYDPDFARAQFELTEGEHEDAPEVPTESEADTLEAAAATVPDKGAHALPAGTEAAPAAAVEPALALDAQAAAPAAPQEAPPAAAQEAQETASAPAPAATEPAAEAQAPVAESELPPAFVIEETQVTVSTASVAVPLSDAGLPPDASPTVVQETPAESLTVAALSEGSVAQAGEASTEAAEPPPHAAALGD
ncbi:ribonuclease G, partial [Corallococcus sp. CA031C]